MTTAFAGVSGPTFRAALVTVGCSLLLAGSAAAQTPAAPLQQALKTAAATAAAGTAAVAEPQ
ncbi:MAG TPA: hypothetical protein VF921_15005, partial [Vicinamibacterales bacterium]